MIIFIHEKDALQIMVTNKQQRLNLRTPVESYNLYTHDLPPPLPSTDYIAFADDITQIIYKFKHMANVTKHTMQQINTFGNKWKISTNKSKLSTILLTRINTADTDIGNDHYEYTYKGKILGLTSSSRGIHTQIRGRKTITDRNLTKLNRFRNVNIQNKRKQYKSLIRPILI